MEVIIPKSLQELLPNINNDERRIAAGCTDIMVAVNCGKLRPKPLLDINRIKEIKVIFEKENRVYIGANVNLSDVIDNDVIKFNYPILIETINTIGSPQIRNRATLGGNIANASPSGDSILALTLLNASLILRSLEGEREILIKDFIKGVGKTDIRKGEFIEYIVIDKNYCDYQSYFEKVGLRTAMVIAICSMGVIFKRDRDKITDIKIAFGAVAPKVIEIEEAEEFLKGKKIDKYNLSRAGEIIEKTVTPISDVRASGEYRKTVCKNLIMRLLEL